MRILVTGACGLLGAHVASFLSHRHEVVGVDRNPWWGDQPLSLRQGDLSEPGFLERIVEQFMPEVVVHCAAMANVDHCEQNPALAHTMNVELTHRLTRAVSRECLFVYISTDGLFKGDRSGVAEEEPPCPRTVYGRTKLQGEQDVQLACPNHLIIRTNFYGWSSGRKPTSGEWLYHALKNGDPITLFEDFFFTPIYVVDLTERLVSLIQSGHRGLFHLAGSQRVSKSQFGALLAQEAGFSLKSVRRGSIDAAHLAASRPKDMSLDCGRFHRLTGSALPDALSGLRRFLKDRERPLSSRFQAPFDEQIPRKIEVGG